MPHIPYVSIGESMRKMYSIGFKFPENSLSIQICQIILVKNDTESFVSPFDRRGKWALCCSITIPKTHSLQEQNKEIDPVLSDFKGQVLSNYINQF